MVEIHSSGFSPCHDLVVWWTTPDLKMMNQDIWFLQGCTLIEKICFHLNHQQTRRLTSRHSGLLSNQKFPFVKNKSVKMFMPVWMTFLDAALWWLLTLASLPITPTSICLVSDTSHGSLAGKVLHRSLGFIMLPHSLRCSPWIHSWKTWTWTPDITAWAGMKYPSARTGISSYSKEDAQRALWRWG